MNRSLKDALRLIKEQGIEITPTLISEVKQLMRIPEDSDPSYEGEDLGISAEEMAEIDQQVGYNSRSNPRESFGQRNPRALFGNVPFLQGNLGSGNVVDRTNRTEGHDTEVVRRAKPSTQTKSGRTIEQADSESQDSLQQFLLDQGIIDSQGKAQQPMKEKMKNQTPEFSDMKVGKQVLDFDQGKPTGRTAEQADAEAQDPLYEFLLDQGIIDSQGKAQKSLKEGVKNQTLEFQREKDRADNDTVQTIPTTTLEELEASPVFDVSQDSDEEDEDDIISWLSSLFGFGSGSREKGMLTKKQRSGQVAGGKGRGLYR